MKVSASYYPVKVFSGNPKSLPFAEADPDENRVKLLLQGGRRDVAPDFNAASDFRRPVARPSPFPQD